MRGGTNSNKTPCLFWNRFLSLRLAISGVWHSSIVNRGSVGRIKKDENFLLHVFHAYSELLCLLLFWAVTLNICSALSRTIGKFCYRHLSVVFLLSAEHAFLCSTFNALCSFPADSIPQELPRTLNAYQVAFHSIIFIIRSKDLSWLLGGLGSSI